MIGQSCIDSVLVSSRLVEVIDGCKLINFNKIISTDHRGFIVDIDLDEYFNMQHFCIDKIESSIINSRRAKYKAKFIETVNKCIEITGLEAIMNNYYNICASEDRLEQLDKEISYVIEKAWKVVEGPQCGVPFLHQKDNIRNKMLYWKARLNEVIGRNKCL